MGSKEQICETVKKTVGVTCYPREEGEGEGKSRDILRFQAWMIGKVETLTKSRKTREATVWREEKGAHETILMLLTCSLQHGPFKSICAERDEKSVHCLVPYDTLGDFPVTVAA